MLDSDSTGGTRTVTDFSMVDTLLNAPFWVFIISLLAAVLLWLAADQFRDQILADSHRLVREVALRYLQVMIVLFTFALIGVVWSVGRMVSQAFGGGPAAAAPTPSPSPEWTPTPQSIFDVPAATPSPTLPVQPASSAAMPEGNSDPDLSEVRTAIVVGTGGVGLNMRDQPGLASTIVGVVAESETVTIQGESREVDGITWYLVVAPDGRQGWVADLYLDIQP